MNDLILSAAEKAGIELSVDLHKFAQLIVQDCCDMVNSHVQWNNPNDCLLVISIKENYGITPNERI